MATQKSFSKWFDLGFDFLLSPSSKKRGEKFILIIAIVSYLVHLLLILLAKQGYLILSEKLLQDPISAIYTPFSFILIYEVYLLLFYLPQSTSLYIGKQYEIITLIVIRRIFKDIGSLEFEGNWFESANDLQFTYDVVTSLVLFFLIFIFYHKIISRKAPAHETGSIQVNKTDRFVLLKKAIAFLLVPVLVILAFYSFFTWVDVVIYGNDRGVGVIADVNNIFFDEFFSILIIVDVLLLLASFFYSDLFHTIMRNSGFVLSTILLKVSFSVSGIVNNALILGSIIFGLLILYIHQLFERSAASKE
jgi:hypothetical protein